MKDNPLPKEFYLLQEQAFVNAVLGKRDELFPALADGVRVQKVIDAIIQSAKDRIWVEV